MIFSQNVQRVIVIRWLELCHIRTTQHASAEVTLDHPLAPSYCQEESTLATYDLRSLQLPELAGSGLRLFAEAMGHAVTRGLLLPNLLRQGGIVKLRTLRFSEDPTLCPMAGRILARPRS